MKISSSSFLAIRKREASASLFMLCVLFCVYSISMWKSKSPGIIKGAYPLDFHSGSGGVHVGTDENR